MSKAVISDLSVIEEFVWFGQGLVFTTDEDPNDCVKDTCPSTERGWLCTRMPEHDGPHLAQTLIRNSDGLSETVAAWPKEES